MPDSIERTIYKLELDGSAYIQGVESLSASTRKLTTEQEKANKALRDAENNLKNQSDYFQQAKKDLEAYSGSNEKYRTQLKKSFDTAQADNQKLTEIVNNNRKAYESATKAAQDFANTSAKATNLQSQTGGKIPTGPGNTSAITSQIAGVLNVADFTKQAQIIEQTKKQFDDLRVSIGLADQRMQQLNATDDEFKLLAPIVEQGKNALNQYDAAAKGAGQSTVALRTQITANNNELSKLALAGEQTSEKYKELQKETAHLTEIYREQRRAVQFLSSETKVLDFGKAAITTAISGFQVLTAVQVLAGGASEEMQKKTLQLFAAMQLLTSLDQLAISVKKGSVLATGAQSAAQAVYTAVVGASTGALKVFKIALATTGIGAAIVLIGYLVSKYLEMRDATAKAAENQKIFNTIQDEAVKNYAKDVSNIELLKRSLIDLNVPQQQRLDLAREYNKTADEGNKIDLTQIDVIDKVAAAMDRQSNAIRRRAIAEAGATETAKAAQVVFEKTNKLQRDFPNFTIDLTTLSEEITKATEAVSKPSAKMIAEAKKGHFELARLGTLLKADLIELKNANDILIKTSDVASKLQPIKFSVIDPKSIEFRKQQLKDMIEASEIAFNKLAALDLKGQEANLAARKKLQDELDKLEGKTKTVKEKKKLEDDFKEREAEFLAAISALAESEFKSELNIRQKYEDKLKKALLKIADDKSIPKNKKGDAERKILVGLAIKLNTGEIDEELKALHKKTIDAQQKLSDELRALKNKNILDQLNLIEDDFIRRAELIDFNEKKEIENAQENTKKRLALLELERSTLGDEKYYQGKILIARRGEDEVTNIVAVNAQKRKELSADEFQSILDQFDQFIKDNDLFYAEETSRKVKALATQRIAGEISQKQYDKALAKIKKDAVRSDEVVDIGIEKRQLAKLDEKLASIENKTSKHYLKLLQQAKDLRKKIAEQEQSVAEGDAAPKPADDKLATIAAYVKATAEVADSVIAFWQAANDAESKALDRSISLQEKRVAAAQRIADRGNAQYLKAEEDRLTELNVKRENAARKQLGIDAALQASQILVAITGAVSRIAGAPFGAETIADIAIIIGALATGYGIVKSLQGNQPKLAKGTKYLKREGQPSGTDTIPIMANEGEAVIPTNKNKAYHPTVAAIYDGTIPAEHLNNFVNHYHKIKAVPQPNYERIREAAELHIGQDGRMSVLLTENNKKLDEHIELQKLTLRAMKNMSVSANIDRNGVAIAVNEYVEQMKIDRKL